MKSVEKKTSVTEVEVLKTYLREYYCRTVENNSFARRSIQKTIFSQFHYRSAPPVPPAQHVPHPMPSVETPQPQSTKLSAFLSSSQTRVIQPDVTVVIPHHKKEDIPEEPTPVVEQPDSDTEPDQTGSFQPKCSAAQKEQIKHM